MEAAANSSIPRDGDGEDSGKATATASATSASASASHIRKRPGDPRIGEILTEFRPDGGGPPRGDSRDDAVVFVLYGCDLGVARNGGRAGARHGPARFLHFLRRLGSLRNPEHGVDLSGLKLAYCEVDLSDLMVPRKDVVGGAEGGGAGLEEVVDELEEAHRRLERAVTAVLESGAVPFVVGGGNDQSFANWRALRRFLGGDETIGVVNIDAHLDVRPVDARNNNPPSSGTPFRQILEMAKNQETAATDDAGARTKKKKTTVLWEFAAQGSQCSQQHADYVTEMGGSILWLKDVRENAAAEFRAILDLQRRTSVQAFVSFDLDSIRAADCPGVSCPANDGLAARDALEILRAAGEADHVRLVDLSELNPAIEGYVTPRLAVQMAYHFLVGFCRRASRRQPKAASYRLRISNLSQLVCVEDVQRQGFRTGEHMSQLNAIENGTVLVDQDGLIAYAGSAENAPDIDPCQVDVDLDGRGKAAIPGLCDAHTHAVWAGDRVHEFAVKLAGASYMDIHSMGGGIHHTVEHTRRADEETLYRSLADRLDRMNANGTTLAECKSGYGLNTATELKMLRVIDRAQRQLSRVDVVGNFCGAHSIPRGMTEQQALDTVINEMIPALAREQTEGRLTSVRLVDVFAEQGVFSTDSAEKILEAGAGIGLLPNFHGDELTYQACGELAGKMKCRAVSHLEHVSDEGIAAMKDSNTAAVLLPSTAFVLRITPPPARKLIDAGVPVALGTDFNPNAHCLSMPHAMNLACVTMKMTVEEALVASSLNAAFSMGMQDSHGSLEVGKRGDIVVVNEARWEHIIYQFGGAPPLYSVIKDGVPR